MKFRKGQKVRRIKDYYNFMRVGDVGTVLRHTWHGVDLKEYGNGHNAYNLKLIGQTNPNNPKIIIQE